MENIKYIKNSRYAGLFFALVLLVSFACTDRIFIETEDAVEHLVIYGYITTDTKQHSIRITRSAGYFSIDKPEGISGGIVSVRTNGETILFTESDDEPGLYLSEPDVYGVEGQEYHLSVVVDFDRDGVPELYEASSYLPHSARIDTIELKEESIFFSDYITVNVYGKLPEDGIHYYKFHVFRNHVAVNDSLMDFSIIDDEYVEVKELNGLSCFYLDQEEDKTRLEEGDLVTLRVDVITKEYAEFLENAQSEVAGNNPIFSGPPANVQTNIKAVDSANLSPIVGFFSAYSSRSADTIYEK